MILNNVFEFHRKLPDN